jgi:hypothetical protein
MNFQITRPMLRASFALLTLIAIAGCSTPEQVLGTNWIGAMSTPKGMEHYPPGAFRRKVTGWAMLRCTMGPASEARDCIAIGETPSGWGFAKAALGMTDQVRAVSGKSFGTVPPPPGRTFFIPVNFCLPDHPDSCVSQNKPAQVTLGNEGRNVEGLIQRGQCVEAATRAARLEQPLLSEFVAAQCRATGAISSR